MLVGLSLEEVRNVAIVVVAGAAVLAVLVAWVVKAVASKLLSLLLVGVLAAVVWTQRTSVQDCADRVGTTLADGAVDDTTCTFFGREVSVTAPFR